MRFAPPPCSGCAQPAEGFVGCPTWLGHERYEERRARTQIRRVGGSSINAVKGWMCALAPPALLSSQVCQQSPAQTLGRVEHARGRRPLVQKSGTVGVGNGVLRPRGPGEVRSLVGHGEMFAAVPFWTGDCRGDSGLIGCRASIPLERLVGWLGGPEDRGWGTSLWVWMGGPVWAECSRCRNKGQEWIPEWPHRLPERGSRAVSNE